MSTLPSRHAKPDRPEAEPSIENLPIASLKPFGRALKQHRSADIDALARAITAFGRNTPLLIDAHYRVVCGAARLEAARRLGFAKVPCLRILQLDEAKMRGFRIAETEFERKAGWDQDALSIELSELNKLELDFSLELTGLSAPRIDALVLSGDLRSSKEPPLPAAPVEPVARPGDLWLLGEHRLMCADATRPDVLEELLQGQHVRTVFTDPPYNVPIKGHVTSRAHHGEFIMASGEMAPEAFAEFLAASLQTAYKAMAEGGLCYFCMDWRHLAPTAQAARDVGLELLNLIVWDKATPGMGSFYRSQHELIFLFKKGVASHRNRVELGVHGRNRSNVWTYEGMIGAGASKAQARDMHPTVKPLALVRDALLDSTDRGDLVLDLFAGSGTTLLAAEQLERRARVVELDPKYVDTTLMRWEGFTGQEARLAATGRTWRETRAERAASQAENSSGDSRGRPTARLTAAASA